MAKLRGKKKASNKRQAQQVAGQTNTLADQLAGAADLKFSPQEDAINEELRSTKAQRGTIGKAFDTYKGRLDEIATAQRTGWQQAMAQNAALAGQVGSTLHVGATGNAALDAQVQGQQQGGNATEANAINTQGSLLNSLGLSEGNDLARRAGATDVARQEHLDQVDSRLHQIGRERTNLAGQKGSFMVDLLRQIQQDDAKNEIARGGLQIDATKAELQHSEFLKTLDVNKMLARIRARDINHDNALGDAQLGEKTTNDQASNSETSRHNKTAEGIAQQNANANTKRADNAGNKNKDGTAGMSKADRRRIFGDVRKLKGAGSEAAQLIQQNGGNQKAARQALSKRHGGHLSQGDINVAMDLAVHGKVTNPNQTYLKTKYNGYLPADFGGRSKKKAKKKGK